MVWERRESVVEKGGSFKVWGRVGGWTSKIGRGVRGCGLWRGICIGWEDFSKNAQLVVGLGNRERFWQDGWYGDQPFQLPFPRLYGIAIDREAFVEASLSRQGAKDRRIWMIGRWTKGCIFLVSWEPILLQWMLETK